MLTCRLEVRRETFDSVGDDWRRLLGELPAASVFATPEWQRAWWECFKDGLDLKLMSLRVEGEVRGVAPLIAREGEYTFLGDADLVDYHELLHAGIEDDAFYGAILERLGKCSDCTSLRLAAVPEWSPSFEALPRAARELGWRVEVSQSDVAPGLPLPGTWDEYLAGLSKKDRHELRRKMRRLESAGVLRQQMFSAPEDVESALDDFFRLHRKSTPDKEAFMTPEREAFFRHAVSALARAGMSRLYFLELDGIRVATSVCFVYHARNFIYNSGYDPEYRHLSVGLLNHALCIKSSIDEGLEYFDFMRGDESYKYHLGGSDRAVYDVFAIRD